jgi:hypothetical protein
MTLLEAPSPVIVRSLGRFMCRTLAGEVDDETDGKDENSAYLEFLSEGAQKFQNLDDNNSDDELGEESLLEIPLDEIEP